MELNIAFLNLPKTTTFQLKQMGYNNVSDIEPNLIKEKFDVETNLCVPETKSALEIYNEELLNGCILSYNEKLDSVLLDAIIPKKITELAGESGSGKTQVCFHLCISVQLPKWCGGMEGEAIYIDTNSNFASHRVTELAEDLIKKYNSIKSSVDVPYVEFDKTSILQHIYYIKICDVVELLACIKQLENYLSGKQVRLIVIDSFAFIMRMVDLKDRKTLISKILCDLRSLSRIHNLIVVITNDFTTRVNKGESYITPSLGDSFYHLINTRILLSKKDSLFQAKLEKNIIHGQKETSFYL
ncbi:DNA repair protein RAD51 homolog 3-like isoform X1 [Anoplophora glabripennis]|uniref:DNA repair protein RAD51 homolog 3-like isoform X1 n=1 Tax=Anoplophora glabripennis TaxID=217634 RepID=UPI000874A1C0|nr:DNA repair protein RAD51 homolog 3-like isoform X1 [Anoplophora glabripennis]